MAHLRHYAQQYSRTSPTQEKCHDQRSASFPRACAQTAEGPVTLAIPIRNKAVAITDPGAAVAYGTAVLGALPPGNLVYLGAVAYLKMSSASAGLSATYNATAAVGTGATADATLSGAEVDLLAAAAAGAATAKVSPMLRLASTDALGGGIIDNTAGNLNANLNVTVPDADISAGSSITVNGVLYLSFVVLGDD